jgi:hypothetical protein
MAHHVRGIVGPRSALERTASLGLPEEPRELDVGMAWLPVTEAVMTALAQRTPAPAEADVRFERLGWGVIELCSELSRGGRLAYLETEYFGQVGQQLASVFEDGARTVETATVNEALRAIGVVARAEEDEWDTVGLDAHRVMPDE